MYLTIHPVLGLPGPDRLGWVDDVLAALGPDAAGALVARSDGGSRGHVCLLWPDADLARRCAATSGDVAGPVLGTGSVYRAEVFTVPDPAGPARLVQLVEFTGPRSGEWVAAFERSGRDRLWPAVRRIDGVVGTVIGIAEDGAAVALSLAQDGDALDRANAAIMSTPLLPGERPELLTGPDRIDRQRLVHADLPEFGTVAVRS